MPRQNLHVQTTGIVRSGLLIILSEPPGVVVIVREPFVYSEADRVQQTILVLGNTNIIIICRNGSFLRGWLPHREMV